MGMNLTLRDLSELGLTQAQRRRMLLQKKPSQVTVQQRPLSWGQRIQLIRQQALKQGVTLTPAQQEAVMAKTIVYTPAVMPAPVPSEYGLYAWIGGEDRNNPRFSKAFSTLEEAKRVEADLKKNFNYNTEIVTVYK
jgi:hypothetical protein